MKKFLIMVVMMAATITASAQQETGTFSLTPKLGINLANFSGDISNNSIKIAFAAGVEGMYQFTPLVGLSAGLIYSLQGCNGSDETKLNYNFINIPVLANFYPAQNFALKIGLQPAFVASAKQKINKQEYDVKDNVQSIEFSVPIGASYEISNIVIDARYNLGLAKVNKGNGSIRNSVFQITVGYKFQL